MNFEQKYEQLQDIIRNSNRIVFFCGAGISTGSGIPDFRSANGLYNQKYDTEHSPEYLLSRDCLRIEPEIFYDFYKAKMDVRNYEPNVAHRFVALMEKQGKSMGVVSQNIDMLFEKAGCKKLFKVHGSIGSNHCARCGRKYGIDTVFDRDGVPYCDCSYHGNYIVPDVVLYGDPLPVDAVNGAYEAIANSDCLIICGTSLNVYPIAEYVNYIGENLEGVERNNIRVVAFNIDPLKLKNRQIDVQFNEDMFPIFERLIYDFS